MIQSYRLAFTDSVVQAFHSRGAAGRWNSKGTLLIYTAEHPALAAIEMLNAWSLYGTMNGYHLYRCTFTKEAVTDELVEAAAKVDLRDRPTTMRIGDVWTREMSSVALRVPSVVAPASYNYLLNPEHPDFERAVRRESLGRFEYDERVLELLGNAGRK